jgi:RNAse (barnase) inhibitor barstar
MAESATSFSDYTSRSGWVHVIASTESEFDDVVSAGRRESSTPVRMIRGHRCHTAQSLLHEFAAALQFPHYFGDNWDALEECLNDLEWLHTGDLILCISNADKVLVGHRQDFETFVSILRSAHEGSLRHLFIHSTPHSEEAVRQRYSKAGLPL